MIKNVKTSNVHCLLFLEDSDILHHQLLTDLPVNIKSAQLMLRCDLDHQVLLWHYDWHRVGQVCQNSELSLWSYKMTAYDSTRLLPVPGQKEKDGLCVSTLTVSAGLF